MIVHVVVDGQSLRWYGNSPEVADNSISFVQFQFDLPGSWDDLVVVAQFTQGKTYNQSLTNRQCTLPVELTAGPCELSIFGYSGEGALRATTLPLAFNISKSGFVSDATTPIPPTPDLYAQLIDQLKKALSDTVDPDTIDAAVQKYLEENPPSAYTLPVATPETLGGVQPAAKTEDMTQSVGVDKDGGLWTVPRGNGGSSEKEMLLINYTVAEPVSMVDIPITEEMRTAIANATCIRWRLTLSGDETATDTTGYGTAELKFWCGWEIGTLLPNTSDLVPSAENKSWAVGNVNGYVFQSAAIKQAGIMAPTAKDVNTRNFDLRCVCYGTNKSLFSGTVIKMDQANTVLRLTTSLPIGTGSRIILAVS